ncbi:hypothetical protein SAMN04515695_4348 [Pseudovibrio sp. Tun.PSC04-5.I4]|nr:hypothetical protein SAMN04515695_4348 [Pseudovibrio sp. Tun.PSC04-5.I4]
MADFVHLEWGGNACREGYTATVIVDCFSTATLWPVRPVRKWCLLLTGRWASQLDSGSCVPELMCLSIGGQQVMAFQDVK